MKKIYTVALMLLLVLIGKQSTAQEIINTIAGDGTSAYSGDGGPAISAEFQLPISVALDTSGNLYIIDLLSATLREINASSGIINTIAGINGYVGDAGDGGDAGSAVLYGPTGVSVDAYNNIYIADIGNNSIREINGATNIINRIAGNDTAGFSGDGGPATAAKLNSPVSAAVDDSGNIYIADQYNNRIRKVNYATGIINTIAGTGIAGFFGDGGLAIDAKLDTPSGVAVDHAGNVYIADYSNARIRKITVSTGTITTIAGTGVLGYSGDAEAATSAQLSEPIGLSIDNSNNVYIADQGESTIRKITASTGIISTVAGNGIPGFSGDGNVATSAELKYAIGVCTNASGNIIYIADKVNYRIREVYPQSLAVKEIPSENSYQIFPNPSTGNFTIQTNDNQPYNLVVYNTAGEIVYNGEVITKCEIDLTSQPAGVYFLQMQSAGKSVIVKLLIYN